MTNALVVRTSHRTPSDSTGRTATRSPDQQGASEVMVEFRALGLVEAMVSDRQLDLGPPKQRALLALLVSQVGQPVAVDVIFEALWAGHPPSSAMTSLQAYVANLRRLLEPERAPRAPARVLRTCLRGYLLDNSVVDVDVLRFNEHAAAGWQAWARDDPQRALREFEAGLGLWRGQAYSEVANTPCVVPEVTRLEEMRLAVFEARCAALLAVGAHEVAAAELGAFMKANPLREYGCELLSLALYRAGRQADALAVLRSTEVRLTKELGLDPRPALQHLKREILNQAPTLDWRSTPAAPATAPSARPPVSPQVATTGPPPSPDADEEVFVGRHVALRQLTEALAAARAGRGRIATVSGEAGIGKTSLLQRFAELAGAPVLWGSCPEHVTAPSLWTWRQVLRAAAGSFPQRSLPGPVAELLEAQQLVDGEDLASVTLRRFEAIVEYLTDLSLAAPLVVILDHLHRADSDSLRLLSHLAESVPASRLLLVMSYRSDEASMLAETLAALARRELMRTELKGLSLEETQALAYAMLHQEVSTRTAERLYERTEGNPFFLRELIKLLTVEQRMDDPWTAPVPVPVREVALRRIARLPEPAAELVSAAAVAGRHFDIKVVAEVVSIDIDTALELLDTGIAAGLLVEDQRRLGWFRFTHALVAQALYDSIGRLRRARLHRRIGAVAGRLWARSTESAAEIARHWLLAAELDPKAAALASTHVANPTRDAKAAGAAHLAQSCVVVEPEPISESPRRRLQHGNH